MKKNVLRALSVAGLLSLGAVGAVPAAAPGAAPECNRACLEGFVEKYFDAVVADDPKLVPISPNVKFTEDGQRLLIGDGLWNTAKAKGKYRLFVTDVPAQEVAVLATIQEDHRDPDKFNGSLIALRLRVHDGQITEIEQFLVRPDASNNNRTYETVDNMAVNPLYLTAVPQNERLSRAALIADGNKYFSGMQRNDGKGDYNFTDDCVRHENGGQSTMVPLKPGQKMPDPKTAAMYSANWTCKQQFQSGLLHFVNRIRDRRFVAVDQERGIVFAFGFFDHSGGQTRHFTLPDGRKVVAGPVQPYTWEIAEMFKIDKGNIRKIDAFLQRVPYGMNSGWSTWEQGMSDHARDVTMEAATGIF